MSSNSSICNFEPISLNDLKVHILNIPSAISYHDIFLSVIYLNEEERNDLFSNLSILERFKYISTLLNNNEKIELLKYIKEIKKNNNNNNSNSNNNSSNNIEESNKNIIITDSDKLRFLNSYSNKYTTSISISYWDDDNAHILSSDNSELYIHLIRQMMYAYGDINPYNNSIYAATALKNYINELLKILVTNYLKKSELNRLFPDIISKYITYIKAIGPIMKADKDEDVISSDDELMDVESEEYKEPPKIVSITSKEFKDELNEKTKRMTLQEYELFSQCRGASFLKNMKEFIKWIDCTNKALGKILAQEVILCVSKALEIHNSRKAEVKYITRFDMEISISLSKLRNSEIFN